MPPSRKKLKELLKTRAKLKYYKSIEILDDILRKQKSTFDHSSVGFDISEISKPPQAKTEDNSNHDNERCSRLLLLKHRK